MKDDATGLVFLCAFFASMLVGMIFLFVRRKTKGSSSEYDERQILARNFAYKCTFFILLAYILACAALDLAEIAWATMAAQMFIGLFLSVTAFVLICVFNDAYFNLSGGRKGFIILWVAIAVLQWAITIFGDDPFFTNGVLNERVICPCCALMLTLTLISIGIKQLADKRAAKAE